MLAAGAEGQKVVAINSGDDLFLAGVGQHMADGHLRLAAHQLDAFFVVIAVAGIRIVDVLGPVGAGLVGLEAPFTFVQGGQGRKAPRIVIVAGENTDAGLEEAPADAGFLKADGSEFLHRPAGGAAGALGAGRLLAGVARIDGETVEPVGRVILALIGDVQHHARMVEAVPR